MNFSGILIGLSSFLLIGLFHPIVIKGEYYFGKRIWPVFLILGLICMIYSLISKNETIGTLAAVLGFTFLWSIHELFEQERRVKKGWFPSNPKRK